MYSKLTNKNQTLILMQTFGLHHPRPSNKPGGYYLFDVICCFSVFDVL